MSGIDVRVEALMARRLGIGAAIANTFALQRGSGTARLRLGNGGSVAVRRSTADFEAFDEVFLGQIYADDFIQLFDRGRPRESVRTVLDVGAHVGCSARYFADRYPQARICAVEPEPGNVAMLRQNVKGHDRIVVVEGALWSESTELSISGAPGASTGWQVDDGAESGTVRGLTVDDVLREVGWDHVDVMKIDIEGAERAVFEDGDLGWLDAVDLIFIELHDWKAPGASRAFHAAVASDFEEFVLDGVVGAVRTARPRPRVRSPRAHVSAAPRVPRRRRARRPGRSRAVRADRTRSPAHPVWRG